MVTNNDCNFGTGTAGQVLTSNGAGVAPTFQAAAGGGVTGPGSSTNNGVATWNGTGGTALFSRATPLVDSSGRMTNSNQPCFLAYLNTGGQTVGGGLLQVPFDTVVFDNNSNFTTGASALFTAPVTGRYFFQAVCSVANTSAIDANAIRLVATSRSFREQTICAASTISANGSCSIASVVDMTANDTIYVTITRTVINSTLSASGSPYITYFCGYLVC